MPMDRRIYYSDDAGAREVASFYRHEMGVCCGLRTSIETDGNMGSQFLCDKPIDREAECWVCLDCQQREMDLEGLADTVAAKRTADWDWGRE